MKELNFLFAAPGDWVQLIVLMVIFIVILFGTYMATKFVGNFQIRKSSSKNMTLIEAISVGPQKFLQLVKVGEEYLLIGITKDKITFIKEIDKSNIDLSIYEKRHNKEVVPFQKQLEKFLNKKNDNK